MATPADPQPVAGVDVGGTFTDVVLMGPGQAPRAVKVPTTTDDQSAGLVDGLRVAGDVAVGAVAHGTTTATNAVLERKTARTVLVTTDGFRDLLVIARQDRPSLYDLSAVRPTPLVPSDRVVTVRERVASNGSVVVALHDDELERVAAEVEGLQPEAVAVCLLFSYANPEHELAVCEAIAARIDVPVTRSSDLLPEFREYERASTCVLDAAVAPVMGRYLGALQQRLPATDITVMTSGGGVASVEDVARAPVLTLLSGPAAGVVAAAAIASEAGFDDAVAFDMGGTSTDVCLVRNGVPEIATEATIAGLPFGTPSVAVHTVGAGGGSLAWLDTGGALRVGPQSAGAVPGPACYRRGGDQPTVTDAHAVLGHLLDGQPLGSSGLTLDRAAALSALATVPGFADPAEAAEGVLTVVQATMLRALQRVTTEKGVDPAGLVLVAYGGAGPLHAASLARELGCAAAVIPPAPGVLSALGLLLAPPRREVSRTVMLKVARDSQGPDLSEDAAALRDLARQSMSGATVALLADCRYEGQSHELRIALPDDGDLARLFDQAHATAYGYSLPDGVVEIVTLRAVAQGRPVLPAPPSRWEHGAAWGPASADVTSGGVTASVPVLHRSDLAAGESISGPALITQADCATVLRDGDTAEVLDSGSLVVRW